MPFTTYHLGPALAFGIPLRKQIHLPTFIVANVIIDLEPLFVILLGVGCKYPLHGYFHTYLSALLVGIVGGYLMFILEDFFKPLYKNLLLESDKTYSLKSYVIPAILGIATHVTLDSPINHDIRPFFPLKVNPLFNPAYTLEIYLFCFWMGVIGIVLYLGLIGSTLRKRL